jgi:hypothetical protein
MLYLRIEDKAEGTIYATHQLGKILSFGSPDIELDDHNTIHVLQNSAPKVFTYTKVDLDGKILDRKIYEESPRAPALHRQNGEIHVVGGLLEANTHAPGASATPKPPSLSDRPVPVPND